MILLAYVIMMFVCIVVMTVLNAITPVFSLCAIGLFSYVTGEGLYRKNNGFKSSFFFRLAFFLIASFVLSNIILDKRLLIGGTFENAICWSLLAFLSFLLGIFLKELEEYERRKEDERYEQSEKQEHMLVH